MSSDPSVSLASFQCESATVRIRSTLIGSWDLCYPLDPDSPVRLAYNTACVSYAKTVFGNFPVLVLWPLEDEAVSLSNGICRYRGVRVIACCDGVRPGPEGRPSLAQRAGTRQQRRSDGMRPGPERHLIHETLLVIWFQPSHELVPDLESLGKLEGLAWSSLAGLNEYND